MANLILSNTNPFENLNTLTYPEWVMIRGRKLDKVILQSFIDVAHDRKTLVALALRYLEYLLVEKYEINNL